MFYSTGPHYCPVCPPVLIGRTLKQSAETQLSLSESDYSGCGVDMANCPKCGRGFCLSYKLYKITPEPSWDVEPKEQ
jgi:hypothetical protein